MFPVDSLRFRVARRSELAEALNLRRATFQEERGFAPLDAADSSAIQLIAVDDDNLIVSTARFLGPVHRPFELERFVELAPLLGSEASPALVGGFCVRRDYRDIRKSIYVQVGMMKLMYCIARTQCVSDLVMYTFRDLVAFYRAAAFKPLDHTFYHVGYRQHMHIMALNLADLERQLKARSDRVYGLFVKARVEIT